MIRSWSSEVNPSGKQNGIPFTKHFLSPRRNGQPFRRFWVSLSAGSSSFMHTLYNSSMHVDFRDLSIQYPNQEEFDTLKEEIFKQNSYYVEFASSTPFIIDAGSHIGMSALYFHKLYPQASLTCIEPNPFNLTYLEQNLEDNLIQATVLPRALVGRREKRAQIPLYTHPKWSLFSSLHKGGWTGEDAWQQTTVETLQLSSIITSPVDLVKLDIEGSETDVVEELIGKFKLIAHLMIEFHETPSRPKDKILRILNGNYPHVTVKKDPRKEKSRKNQLYFIEASKRQIQE